MCVGACVHVRVCVCVCVCVHLCVCVCVCVFVHKCNTSICKATRQQSVSILLSQHRLRYADHLARLDDSCLPHELMVSALFSGKCFAGGKKCRWNDLLALVLKKIGLGENWCSKEEMEVCE